MKNKMLCVILGVLYCTSLAEASDDRSSKTLTFRQNPDGLNIDHIISLWNRSVSEPTTSYPTSAKTTAKTTIKDNDPKIESPNQSKLPDTFVERFNYCLAKQKMKPFPDQKIIIKCLKAELITKLHLLLSNSSENIKLFNGYLEFQKLAQLHQDNFEKTNEIHQFPQAKKYSSRVSSKKTAELPVDAGDDSFVPVPLKKPKPNHSFSGEYFENYQKMLKELVARKNGAEISRTKREDKVLSAKTLEKSAKLLATGRKLFSEISNTLDNDEGNVESLTQTILDPELVAAVNNFTRSYSLRFNFYPGISARMTRNENSGVTFDLELDEVTDSEVEDEVEEEGDGSDDGGRGGKKKKPGKKKVPKKLLKKLFPYLLIPFMIQAALLPIVLKFLLFVAIKALIAGKLALILVAFNAIRNASLKSEEDEYIERMSYDHYGYGHGEEYGAWINRRTFDLPDNEGRESDAEEEHMAYSAPYGHTA